jgi:hypothetical protein
LAQHFRRDFYELFFKISSLISIFCNGQLSAAMDRIFIAARSYLAPNLLEIHEEIESKFN